MRASTSKLHSYTEFYNFEDRHFITTISHNSLPIHVFFSLGPVWGHPTEYEGRQSGHSAHVTVRLQSRTARRCAEAQYLLDRRIPQTCTHWLWRAGQPGSRREPGLLECHCKRCTGILLYRHEFGHWRVEEVTQDHSPRQHWWVVITLTVFTREQSAQFELSFELRILNYHSKDSILTVCMPNYIAMRHLKCAIKMTVQRCFPVTHLSNHAAKSPYECLDLYIVIWGAELRDLLTTSAYIPCAAYMYVQKHRKYELHACLIGRVPRHSSPAPER